MISVNSRSRTISAPIAPPAAQPETNAVYKEKLTAACAEDEVSISPEAQKLLDVTRESLYRGIAAAQSGARIGDIGYAVQSYVEQNGFAVVRKYVGHGVGRDMHESPEVPNFGKAGRGVRLTPGMVIAIEPMINAKGTDVRVLGDKWTVVTSSGALSAHFENTIAITEHGPVILTDPLEGEEISQTPILYDREGARK